MHPCMIKDLQFPFSYLLLHFQNYKQLNGCFNENYKVSFEYKNIAIQGDSLSGDLYEMNILN